MHRQCTAIPSEMRYDIVFSYFKKENKEMSEKRCYTVQELQEILGVSRPTIYNLLKKKGIPVDPVGWRKVSYLKEEFR